MTSKSSPIAVEPPPAKSLWSIWRAGAPLLAADRGAIALLVVTAVATGAAEAIVFALAAQVAVALSSGATHATLAFGPVRWTADLTVMLVVAFLLAVLRLIFQLINAYLPARLETKTLAHLQDSLVQAFHNASWAVQSQDREGHLQDLVTNQVARVVMLVQGLAQGISSFVIFCALLVSTFAVGRFAALAIIVVAAILFAILRPLVRLVRKYSAEHALAGQELAAAISETSLLAEEHHVFGTARAETTRLSAKIRAVSAALLRSHFGFWTVSASYNGLVVLLLVGGLMGLHLFQVADLGALGASALLLIRAMAYGQQTQSAYAQMSDAAPFLEKVRLAESRYRLSTPTFGNGRIETLETICLDHVSYRFGPDQAALNDVSLRVTAGSTIGIVGPSGAGKSTLVQILLGLRAPDSGTYQINGHDLSWMDSKEWSNLIAYIPQDPKLLYGSVLENIRFMRGSITQEMIEVAAKQAHIHDEIVSWPGGYQRIVGQRADAISGGQRQRLCIARALASSPKILILDEPTSGLDVHSERMIQNTLAALKGKVTIFIVAHRLSTVSECDALVALRAGRIEASGSPAELAAKDGFIRDALSQS